MTRSEKPFLEALLLDGKGRARPLEVDEVNRWQPDDGTLWIDLNLSNKLARKWLRASDIGYVNVHGSGTQANDPSEWLGIQRGLGDHAQRQASGGPAVQRGDARAGLWPHG